MKENTLMKAAVGLVAALVIGVVGAFKFFEKIDNGYVGVRYSMNGGIKDEALAQGVKFVGIDKVIQSKRKTFRFLQVTARRQRLTSNTITRLIRQKQRKCIKSLEILPVKI